jgi:putative glycosyltransferase
MDLSIVTTMYYSAPYIQEFCRRVIIEAETITSDFEIVIVNDGSPDNALDIAVELHHHDRRVRVVDLSRNFGHHRAMMTGLTQARGKLVFLIDCDLEIRPEVLGEFYTEMLHSRVDVVYGVLKTRLDRLADRLAGEWFYTMFNWLSSDKLPPNITTCRLMSRRYVNSLVQHRERELIIGGLYVITGFAQVPLVVEKAAKGSSTYNLGRKLSLMVNAVTAFSNRPLVFIFYLGLAISLISGIAAAVLAIQALFFGFQTGWPSLIVSVWLLGGLTIFCLGIIGVYLSKIFTEVKQRPYTIIRQHYDRSTNHEMQIPVELESDRHKYSALTDDSDR